MNPRPTAFDLPFGYRLVSNEIRKANRPHRLDCGCWVKPGMSYHRVAMAYTKSPKPQIIQFKRHIVGCLETLH